MIARPSLCFLLLASILCAQTAVPTVVPVTQEPSHHLALENEYVRVFKVEVPPHAATLMHRHDKDYVFVTLEESEISNEVQGKSPIHAKLTVGEVRTVKGHFAHVARNLSDRPFRNVTIELQQSQDGQSRFNDPMGGLHFHDAAYGDIFEMPGVRAYEMVVASGGRIEKHTHNYPHLVVAITDLELKSDSEGKSPVLIKQAAGDVTWVESGLTHRLTNSGSNPARFIVFEFK